jgi:uncharacterized membrane protein
VGVVKLEDRIEDLEERMAALEGHVAVAAPPRTPPAATPRTTGGPPASASQSDASPSAVSSRGAARSATPASAFQSGASPSAVSSRGAARSATPAGAFQSGAAWSAAPGATRARPVVDRWRTAAGSGDVRIEDALGGRVLAWVGGLAVALGVCFLLAIAVSRGWIGEVERTLLAGAVSFGLLAAGALWQERKGLADAARAAAAAGIAGLFATCVVAGDVYALVPAPVALLGALAVGIVATVLALRWEAPGIAALGIVGALLSPALLGALGDPGAIVLLGIATASAVGVLLWQRWTWLACAAFVIATPQWSYFIVADHPAPALAIAVMAGFGLLFAAAAAGFEIRAAAPRLRPGAAVLLALNALVLATVGQWFFFIEEGGGALWLVALAVAHLAAGLAGRRSRRVSDELTLVALVIGVVLADLAVTALLDGLPLVLGWAAGGVVFAALARHAAPGPDAHAAFAGIGAHLLLALGHALVFEAQPQTIGGDPANLAGLAALAAVAAACVLSARLLADGPRAALHILAMAVLAYQTAIALDGVALTLALAAQSIALVMIARRGAAAGRPGHDPVVHEPDGRSGHDAVGAAGRRHDPVAFGGAVAFAAGALGHALAVLAPPLALIDGVELPLAAAAGLGGVAIAALVLAVFGPPERRDVAWGATAVVLLYGFSVELVTLFQPDAARTLFAPGELDVREQGQALLSALWALTGVVALVVGLVRDHAALRLGALALLGLTVGKVFLFDLASLTSLYRVASFIVLGLLLLGGALAWQRIRPRPLPDLRTVPGPLR